MALSVCLLAGGICSSGSLSTNDEGAGRRIITILHDKATTPEQKVLELQKVKGNLSGEDTQSVALLLRSSSGAVMLAIAEAMVRCGQGRIALENMQAIAKERERAIDQFAPALTFIGKNALEISGQAWERFVDAGAEALVDRLREPKDQEELLSILRSRDFIWRPGAGFGVRDRVVRQLCALLKDPNHEVRQEAARDLAGNAATWYVPGSAILPLVAVLQEADETAARAIAGLLKTVLIMGPESDDVSRIKAFWAEWAQTVGKGFDLTNYLLARADSDRGLSPQSKFFLGWQVLYASRELPLDGREKAWRRLRKVFEDDPSAAGLRVRAWYKTLIHMAEREKGSPIRAEALSFLIKLTQSQEPEIRAFSLSLFGEMEGTMASGSEPRLILQQALLDSKATPEERALAAWSLRKALKGDPALIEQMVKLGEYFHGLPESKFRFMAQGHCIGQIAGAFSQALNIKLGTDPSEWRKALADLLPSRK